MFELEHKSEYPPTQESHENPERIDQLNRQGIEYADKRPRGLQMGVIPWISSSEKGLLFVP